MSTSDDAALAQEILAFWFGADPGRPLANAPHWFTQDDAFDAEVRARFAGALGRAAQGAFEDWYDWPHTALARVILLDQFSRNIHRDSPLAFAQDARARHCTLVGLARGQESALSPVQRWFFLLPLMHSESLAYQERGLAEFQALAAIPGLAPDVAEALGGVVTYAERHCRAVARFGRFPHRNAVLGRASTPEEVAWLAAHPEGF